MHELWDKQVGRAPLIANIPKQRFKFLLRILRFDEKTTREAKKMIDKFAQICEFFDQFNNKCRDSYKLSDNTTIDEMLRRFRGRCIFRVYMPAKSGEYGLLFRVLVNAKVR